MIISFTGDPFNNASSTEDAYKTLFVARINPDTSESRLKKEFEIYGPIRKVMKLLLSLIIIIFSFSKNSYL